MNQLDSLYAFLAGNLPERLMGKSVGADAWMDNIELKHGLKDLGLGQRQVAVRQYVATLAWERWPYREYDPDTLFALVMIWLEKHSNYRRDHLSLPAPAVYTELMNHQDAIITIDVPLIDDITLAEDAEQGVIPINDRRYRLAPPQVNVVTAAWIRGADETPGAVVADE